MKKINEYKITLKGTPEADGRPRAKRIGRNISVYDPKSKTKQKIKEQLKELTKDFKVLDTPKNKFKLDDIYFIEMEYKFYFKLPKGKNKRSNELADKEILRNILHIDTDNLIKLYGDVLHDVLYKDDCMVSKVSGEKLFTNNEERVEINIKVFKY